MNDNSRKYLSNSSYREGHVRDIEKKSTAFETGRKGEQYALRGLSSWLTVERSTRLNGDLTAYHPRTGQKVRIEVKTAHRNSVGRYIACLRKSDRYGGTDVSHSDYLLLQTIAPSGLTYLFLIPSHELTGQQITIHSHPLDYKGKWAKYRVATFKAIAIAIEQGN